MDRSFIEKNRAQTQRIRDLAARLTDDQLQQRVGDHWTVATTLAHITFWDRRVLATLDAAGPDSKFAPPSLDVVVNDISLPLWAAIPPREAAQIAIATAEELDRRLEALPDDRIEELATFFNTRYVNRHLHRGEHLDEVEGALKG